MVEAPPNTTVPPLWAKVLVEVIWKVLATLKVPDVAVKDALLESVNVLLVAIVPVPAVNAPRSL